MTEPIEIYRGYAIYERTRNEEKYLQAIQKNGDGDILDKFASMDFNLPKLRKELDERFLYHYAFNEREIKEAEDIYKTISDIACRFKGMYGRLDHGRSIYGRSENNKGKDTYLYSAGGDCYDSVVAVEDADTHEFEYYTVHVGDRGDFYISSFEDSYKKYYNFYPKKLAYIYSTFKHAFYYESQDGNRPVFSLYKDYIVQVHSAENDKYWLEPIYSLPDTAPAYDAAIENKEPVFGRFWSNHTGYMYRRIFETERLILRPWKEEDAESLYRYAKNPEVGPIAGWPVHTSVENSREIINQVLSDTETYAVCLKEDNVAIGSIGLISPAQSHTKAASDELEIGYWIGVPFWGQGLIPEAVKALQEHAFFNLGCSALWCGYYEGNGKSKRCQEKCGFTYHHTEENKPCVLMGDVRTEHFTRITRNEWENMKKR